MDKDELLRPCPFCGGKATLIASKKFADVFSLYGECNKCHARCDGICAAFDKEDQFVEKFENAKSEAIKIWNRRTKEVTL